MRLSSLSTATLQQHDAPARPPGPEPHRPAEHHLGGVLRSAGVGPVEALRAHPPADPLSLAGLGACIDDVGAAALRPGSGPPDPTGFASLRLRLQRAAASLPPPYRDAVSTPLLRTLDELGPTGFKRLLAGDPERQGEARLLLDLAQAVLQPGEGYQARATAAMQEVVSDLYDGFLSEEDRRGVKPPDHGVLPPLVRWGSGDTGPYTWPVTATAAFGAKTAVVSLPAANAQGGLLAWAALAHEAAGHDLLGADEGLRDELAGAVRAGVRAAGLPPAVADSWAERIDETASDVLGVLNMGPASAVGLIGYFRGLRGAWGGEASLSSDGRVDDPHPADLARAYLVAETVRQLSFKGAAAWADRLVAEADRDLAGTIHLGGVAVTPGVAKASAAAVARAIVQTRLGTMEGHALGQIQDWTDQDEAAVAALRDQLGRGGAAGTGAAKYTRGTYAAHVVAAAVYETVSGGTRPDQVMGRMVDTLAAMHAANPTWAPARARASAPAWATPGSAS